MRQSKQPHASGGAVECTHALVRCEYRLVRSVSGVYFSVPNRTMPSLWRNTRCMDNPAATRLWSAHTHMRAVGIAWSYKRVNRCHQNIQPQVQLVAAYSEWISNVLPPGKHTSDQAIHTRRIHALVLQWMLTYSLYDRVLVVSQLHDVAHKRDLPPAAQVGGLTDPDGLFRLCSDARKLSCVRAHDDTGGASTHLCAGTPSKTSCIRWAG